MRRSGYEQTYKVVWLFDVFNVFTYAWEAVLDRGELIKKSLLKTHYLTRNLHINLRESRVFVLAAFSVTGKR